MKRQTISIALFSLLVLGLTSCREKDWVCECTDLKTGTVYNVRIEKVKKRLAKDRCATEEMSVSVREYDCVLN